MNLIMKGSALRNMIGIATLVCMTSVVSAQTTEYEYVRFCPQWEGSYTDHDMGIRLTHRTARYRVPNTLLHLTFTPEQGSVTRALVRTNTQGCTQYYSLRRNDEIRITVYALLRDAQNRDIGFVDDAQSSAADRNPILFESHQFVWNPPDFANETIRDQNIDMAPSTSGLFNMMPAAGEMLNHANLLGWNAGERIRVALSPIDDNSPATLILNERRIERCPTVGSYYRRTDPGTGVHSVCMGEGGLQRKVVFAHEVGHAISRMNSGPFEGAYEADQIALYRNGVPSRIHTSSGWDSDDDENVCSMQSDNRGTQHAFHTREWVGAAAKEGFCQFVAAVTYNRRRPDERFVYYKRSYDFNADTLTVEPTSRNYAFQILENFSTTTDFTQYTRNLCRPPTAFRSMGSERDWLAFFWSLWTAGTDVRYSVNQINAIWRDTVFADEEEEERRTHAWCLPVTTAGGEPRWTCRHNGWIHVKFAPVRILRTTILWPHFRPAVRYLTGKQWEDLEATASRKYEAQNEEKYLLFQRVGEQAGVVFR